jgi:hypothetical protein
MSYISLNLNEPIIKNTGAKTGMSTCFDIFILPGRITTFPYFIILMMNILMAKMTSRNFTLILPHKCKNALVILSDLYIENKNRKKKLATMPENKSRFIIRLAVRPLESKKAMLAIASGVMERPNVMTAFTNTDKILKIKGLPP